MTSKCLCGHEEYVHSYATSDCWLAYCSCSQFRTKGAKDVPKVRVEVSLHPAQPPPTATEVALKMGIQKTITFVCALEEGERVFKAACDAAVRARNGGTSDNKKETKVGGTT